ncbi:LPD7 domain-containing protein [Vibrio cholerae]
MLVRVRDGKSGVIEYLIYGQKSGRDHTRDELDERICIDGNIQLTDEIINDLKLDDRPANYLHITLSFSEKDISEEKIEEAYNKYKSLLMSAYRSDEYNVYAEIHYPKIKSYVDWKTGEVVERFPHVHMVLPMRNLLTDKYLNPYGKYDKNIKHFDALQEHVNISMGISSPYDSQRENVIKLDGSDFISRYKGDTFKGSSKEFKSQILDIISEKDIRTVESFEKELSLIGEVSRGKIGSDDEYLKVRPFGEKKFVRLKESCFKDDFIINRILKRERPTKKTVDSLVKEWVELKSKEIKYIHTASPKIRNQYYHLDRNAKEVFINDFENKHFNKDDTGRPQRQEASNQFSFERNRLRGFTEIRNGLPSMPPRGLVRADRERAAATESLLSVNEYDNVESQRASRDHELRRSSDWHRGNRRGGLLTGLPEGNLSTGLPVLEGFKGNELPNKASRSLRHSDIYINRSKALGYGLPIRFKLTEKSNYVARPVSFVEQMLADHIKDKTYQQELDYFRVIRAKLDPDYLLDHFEKSHGLIKNDYSIFYAKDGTPRIRIEKTAFNVSDFCTKHMQLPWEETKVLLSDLYKKQLSEKEEERLFNSISFASSYATGYQSKAKLSRLEETIWIFRHLQRQESYEESFMALNNVEKYRTELPKEDDNEIINADISLSSIADNFRRQQMLARELQVKLNELVAIKDLENKKIEFADSKTGEKVFKDLGHVIILNHRKPSNEHVAAALMLASEKFGAVKLSGTKAFKQQVIDIAVAKNLNIVFDSSKLQKQFLDAKAAFKEHQEKQGISPIESNLGEINSIDIVGRRDMEVSPTAKIIKSALQDSDRIKSDLAREEITDLDALAYSHLRTLKTYEGTVGYRYVEEAISSGIEHKQEYAESVDKAKPVVDKETVSNDAASVDLKAQQEASPVADEEVLVTLVNHGVAPYMHKKGASQSYFVELSNGDVKWGVGLNEAIQKSKARIGDVVDVRRVGEKDVVVPVLLKDDQGKTIGRDNLNTIRNEWVVEVKGTTLIPTPAQEEAKSNDAIPELIPEEKRTFDVDSLKKSLKQKRYQGETTVSAKAAESVKLKEVLSSLNVMAWESIKAEGDNHQSPWMDSKGTIYSTMGDHIELPNKLSDKSEGYKLGFDNQLIRLSFNVKDEFGDACLTVNVGDKQIITQQQQDKLVEFANENNAKILFCRGEPKDGYTEITLEQLKAECNKDINDLKDVLPKTTDDYKQAFAELERDLSGELNNLFSLRKSESMSEQHLDALDEKCEMLEKRCKTLTTSYLDIDKWGTNSNSLAHMEANKLVDRLIQALGNERLVMENDRLFMENGLMFIEATTITTGYSWNEEKQKLQVTFNGASPSMIPDEVLEKIVKQDAFLSHYSAETVKTGYVDRQVAGAVQPIAKDYDFNGNVVSLSEDKPQLKM